MCTMALMMRSILCYVAMLMLTAGLAHGQIADPLAPPKDPTVKPEPRQTKPPEPQKPAADAAKPDAPKSDTPKSDAPKSDAPKSDVPKPDKPAEPPGADAPAPAEESPLTSAENSAMVRLLSQLQKRIEQPPAADATPEQIRQRLDEIIVDATTLIDQASASRLRMTARSLQLQAIYLRLSRWPKDPMRDSLLLQMESSARKLAEMDEPQAGPLGEFWLMMAQILQINQGAEPPLARRGRFAELLEKYLEKHPAAAPSESVKQMLADLRKAEAAAPATPEPATPTRHGVPPTDAAFELGERKVTDSGIVHYPIRSRYQLDTNLLRVLEPEKMPPPTERTILFVLPVEQGEGATWGDAMAHIQQLDLHNRYGLLVVMPTFSHLPWYADHPTEPGIRQESYLAKAVVPAVDKLYPSSKPRRLLLGFSKSGFGALSMLLRWPDLFAGAAAWDAPLMKDKPDNFGMGPIFGTQANFDKYRLDHGIREHGRMILKNRKVVLMGFDHFKEHMERAHSLLEQLNIPHVWIDGPQRRHHWETGWVAPAVEALVNQPAAEDKGD